MMKQKINFEPSIKFVSFFLFFLLFFLGRNLCASASIDTQEDQRSTGCCPSIFRGFAHLVGGGSNRVAPEPPRVTVEVDHHKVFLHRIQACRLNFDRLPDLKNNRYAKKVQKGMNRLQDDIQAQVLEDNVFGNVHSVCELIENFYHYSTTNHREAQTRDRMLQNIDTQMRGLREILDRRYFEVVLIPSHAEANLAFLGDENIDAGNNLGVPILTLTLPEEDNF
jgi:hypothetical protein